jgi:hypothetical protein
MSFETKKINNIIVKPLNNTMKGDRTLPAPLSDPVSGDQPYILMISAKVGSGKSVLVSNLIKIHKGYFKRVYFCSSNIKENEEGYKEFTDLAYKGNHFKFNQNRLFDTFNEGILKTIVDDIQECEEENDNNPLDHYLIIVDDLSQAFLKLGYISHTILKTRHIKLTWWIITQRFRNIHPSIRAQTSYLISFATRNTKEREAMCELIDINLNDFTKLLDFSTSEKFNFLFCDLSKNPAIFYKNLDQKIIFRD